MTQAQHVPAGERGAAQRMPQQARAFPGRPVAAAVAALRGRVAAALAGHVAGHGREGAAHARHHFQQPLDFVQPLGWQERLQHLMPQMPPAAAPALPQGYGVVRRQGGGQRRH